jgi:hypothetical protein
MLRSAAGMCASATVVRRESMYHAVYEYYG